MPKKNMAKDFFIKNGMFFSRGMTGPNGIDIRYNVGH